VRFWAPSSLVNRLDRLIGDRALNRSDASRQALLAGLDVLEQRGAHPADAVTEKPAPGATRAGF
jgi:hypothetical protein